MDDVALEGVAVLLQAQDGGEEEAVGDADGAAAVDGDLDGAGEGGLDAAQYGGHGDGLAGAVDAEQQGGGEVLFLYAVEGAEPLMRRR